MECVDDGPGVPKESRERIFETFYRADSATTESGRGSGIGLAADDYLVKPFSRGSWWPVSGPIFRSTGVFWRSGRRRNRSFWRSGICGFIPGRGGWW